jgi:predicted ATPase
VESSQPEPRAAAYLKAVKVLSERVEAWDAFPFSLPFVAELDLTFRTAVTFFVGETGSGKSTVLEAIAALSGYPVTGGGRTETADRHGLQESSALAPTLRPWWGQQPRDGHFFRAETLVEFASLLDQRRADPDFWGDPYQRYGGKSLHTRSHGEAFLALFENRLTSGLHLMDEPEAALSPQRQLALLARMADLVAAGATQFIIATHSPVLLTFPGAQIVNFDDPTLSDVRLEDTSHYQITRGILDCPERYWQHLRSDAREDGRVDS